MAPDTKHIATLAPDFETEGHWIEVRWYPRLHDRHILFNNRCWVAGSSLEDAGKKAFNVIELVDGKALIYAEVARKWKESVAGLTVGVAGR